MRLLTNILLLVFMTIGVYSFSFAGEKVYTPRHGSSERKQIANALRSVVEKELKRAVIFKIDSLNVQDNWAFLNGIPLEKNGTRIDYHNTPYQELIDAGMFDDSISALLHKENDHWKVIIHSIGATDMPFYDWAEKYNAPKGIFKLD